MTTQTNCFLCGTQATTSNNGKFATIYCPVCGDIYFDLSFAGYYIKDDQTLYLQDENNKPLSEKETEKIKNILRYYYKTHSIKAEKTNGNYAKILSKDWTEITKEITYPTLIEKTELLLDWIENKTINLTDYIEVNPSSNYPLFFCKNRNELNEIIDYHVKETKYLKDNGNNNGKIKLTFKGLKHQEEKQKNRINSKQCFVAMWFNDKEDKLKPDMMKIYKDYIKPAVEETDLEFKAQKINDVEHINDINDQIMAEIRRSRFMIADFTGHRGGVYFEAGFGLGLNIPVIFTCHKDWFNGFIKPNCLDCKNEHDQKQERIHFDLAHRNFLLWTDDDKDPDYTKLNLDQFRENLSARINAVIV